MTMHKVLHPRDDGDRLNVLRNEGGRGLSNIADSIDTSIRRLEDYIKISKERLITVTRNNTKNTRINGATITRKQTKQKRIGKKNKCMDILSDKPAKCHTRRLGHVYERETLREKLNLFL